MPDKRLLINVSHSETRIALLEHGHMTELLIERNREQSLVGSIFKGTVLRVLPGMNSAFIDIGLDKAAFLFGGDIFDPDENTAAGREHTSKNRPLSQLIREGQTVIVQVSKEAIGSKGPRVTMHLTIPGRYLVLVPQLPQLSISRRIEDEEEKNRLKQLISQLTDGTYGLIVRTAAAGVSQQELEKEIDYLSKLWCSLQDSIILVHPPSLLFRDIDFIQKTLRDLYNEQISEIIIDDNDAFLHLRHFLTAVIPQAQNKLSLHNKAVALFDFWNIEPDINLALHSRAELPSGGYLIIEETEALTSFDVNTGKFIGKNNVRQTILKTNLEAVKKLVEQLRIRNLGGIIIIDFIDMEEPSDRETLYQALITELRSDRAKTNVLKISELGLVQMTRKRISESLGRKLQTHCPYCDGSGSVRSTETEALDLIREIRRFHIQTGETKFSVRVRSDIRQWIEKKEKKLFSELSKQYQLNVSFEDSPLSPELLQEPEYIVRQ